MSEPANNAVSPPSTTRTTLSSSVVSFTWLLLCLGTVLSWWLSSGASTTPLTDRSSEQFAIIALTIFKMYLVVAVFMGLLRAPLFWHLYSTLLLLVMGGFMLFFTVAL